MFGSFLLWQNANSDGRSDPGELISLGHAGVVSLSLAGEATAVEIIAGENVILATTSFLRSDGTTGIAANVLFGGRVDRYADLTALPEATVLPALAALIKPQQLYDYYQP